MGARAAAPRGCCLGCLSLAVRRLCPPLSPAPAVRSPDAPLRVFHPRLPVLLFSGTQSANEQLNRPFVWYPQLGRRAPPALRRPLPAMAMPPDGGAARCGLRGYHCSSKRPHRSTTPCPTRALGVSRGPAAPRYRLVGPASPGRFGRLGPLSLRTWRATGSLRALPPAPFTLRAPPSPFPRATPPSPPLRYAPSRLPPTSRTPAPRPREPVAYPQRALPWTASSQAPRVAVCLRVGGRAVAPR